MDKCFYCGTDKNLERQICGFWFCFFCLPRAERESVSFLMALYRLLYPWRCDNG